MRPDDDDSDFAAAELLRRAYGRKVDVDTAARHLWSIDSAARSARRRRHVGRRRRAVVSVLTGLMLVASSGAAVGASTGALPGDALYVVKRGTERVRLVLAVRPEANAQARLAIAHERWSEAQRAAEARPETVPALLQEVLDGLKAVEHHGGAVAERALVLRTQVAADSGKIALGAPRAKGSAAAGSEGFRAGQAVAAEGSEQDVASAAPLDKPASERAKEPAKEAVTDQMAPMAPTVAAIPPPKNASSPPKAASPVVPEPPGPTEEAGAVPAPTAAAPATAVPDAGDPAAPPDTATDQSAPDASEVTDTEVTDTEADEAAEDGGAPSAHQGPSPHPGPADSTPPRWGRFGPADGL